MDPSTRWEKRIREGTGGIGTKRDKAHLAGIPAEEEQGESLAVRRHQVAGVELVRVPKRVGRPILTTELQTPDTGGRKHGRMRGPVCGARDKLTSEPTLRSVLPPHPSRRLTGSHIFMFRRLHRFKTVGRIMLNSSNDNAPSPRSFIQEIART